MSQLQFHQQPQVVFYVIAVSSMHGGMPQKERNAIRKESRWGQSRVLNTTDVWARGINARVTVYRCHSLPIHLHPLLQRPPGVVTKSFSFIHFLLEKIPGLQSQQLTQTLIVRF